MYWGTGFWEKVYHNAMIIELEKDGFMVKKDPIKVQYEGVVVGDYYADILVEDLIIVEIKAVENLLKIHKVQLVNYLAGTSLDIGLLINFGSKVEVRRKFREYKKYFNTKRY